MKLAAAQHKHSCIWYVCTIYITINTDRIHDCTIKMMLNIWHNVFYVGTYLHTYIHAVFALPRVLLLHAEFVHTFCFMHAYCQPVPCGVLCCSLLQAGADPRLKAADGMTPVHAAAQMGRTDCLAFLVSSTTHLHT